MCVDSRGEKLPPIPRAKCDALKFNLDKMSLLLLLLLLPLQLPQKALDAKVCRKK